MRDSLGICIPMLAVSDPNQICIGFGVAGIVAAALWRMIVWIRDCPVKPDPWDAEVDRRQLEEAPEACPHCSTPQAPNAWFCPHCGRAVGPYNNLMPYLQVFSEGEVLRNSADRRLHRRPMILVGYLLLGLAFMPSFLLPVYWLSVLRNWRRRNHLQQPIDH
jgi:hypothetical protein